MPASATAALFPGQGSHTSGLGGDVGRAAPELFERCLELVGEDPFARVGESTRFAQPAIFCAGVAGWLGDRARSRPLAFAGHSLGELAALVAADAIDPASGLELAVRRGELMDAAAEGAGAQGMVALLGSSAADACALAMRHGVHVANDNSPKQLVLAGDLQALRRASEEAHASGARTIFLEVSGAFHTLAMAGAVEPYRRALDAVEFRPPAAPVMSGASAQPFVDPQAELAEAIVRPVRWRETMLALWSAGARTFADFGPGHVLARLVRANLPGAVAVAVADVRDHGDARESTNAREEARDVA